ncbi:hypothetical protein LTR22_004072 [Elasticomyces elasticus]|nr:hypothetical protein LTR22_004072 [Elasticomyces elasticus]KAK4931605.1 hypothetical protein LTR49_001996 [Elasticomyces elasticus]KAK5766764.1 hypothetical protein LTS12_003116 [Elasticomyces elasticus]
MSHQHKDSQIHISDTEVDVMKRPRIEFEVDLAETREGDDVAVERYQKDGLYCIVQFLQKYPPCSWLAPTNYQIALLAEVYPQSNLNDVVGKKMYDIAQDVINADEYGEDRPVGGYHSTEQPPAKLIAWLGAAYICHESAAQHEDPIVAFGEDWEGTGIDADEDDSMGDIGEADEVNVAGDFGEAEHDDDAEDSSEVEQDDELMDCDEVGGDWEPEEDDEDYEALRAEYATSHQRLVAWVNSGGRHADGRAAGSE